VIFSRNAIEEITFQTCKKNTIHPCVFLSEFSYIGSVKPRRSKSNQENEIETDRFNLINSVGFIGFAHAFRISYCFFSQFGFTKQF